MILRSLVFFALFLFNNSSLLGVGPLPFYIVRALKNHTNNPLQAALEVAAYVGSSEAIVILEEQNRETAAAEEVAKQKEFERHTNNCGLLRARELLQAPLSRESERLIIMYKKVGEDFVRKLPGNPNLYSLQVLYQGVEKKKLSGCLLCFSSLYCCKSRPTASSAEQIRDDKTLNGRVILNDPAKGNNICVNIDLKHIRAAFEFKTFS